MNVPFDVQAGLSGGWCGAVSLLGTLAAKSVNDSGVGMGRNALIKSPLKGGVGRKLLE